MINRKILLAFSAIITAIGLSACGGGAAKDTSANSTSASNGTAANNANDGKIRQEEAYSYIEFDDMFEQMKVEDIGGNKIDSSIFKNADVTMINIWGTFCSPCIKEMPDLGEINKAYQDEKNADGSLKFQIVGLVGDAVAADRDGYMYVDTGITEKAKAIAEKTGADYTHLVPTGNFGINLLGGGYVKYFPSTIFVDRDGDIIETSEGEIVVGAHKKADWEKLIKEVILDEKD